MHKCFDHLTKKSLNKQSEINSAKSNLLLYWISQGQTMGIFQVIIDNLWHMYDICCGNNCSSGKPYIKRMILCKYIPTVMYLFKFWQNMSIIIFLPMTGALTSKKCWRRFWKMGADDDAIMGETGVISFSSIASVSAIFCKGKDRRTVLISYSYKAILSDFF